MSRPVLSVPSDPNRKPEHDQPTLEALSAYLDGQLSNPERTELEQRLLSDPALQTELTSLRMVKDALQNAPILKVPRDFTLDPARFHYPTRPLFVRWTRTISAVAAILVIAFVTWQILRNVATPCPETSIRPSAGPVNTLVAVLPTNLITGTPNQNAAVTGLMTASAVTQPFLPATTVASITNAAEITSTVTVINPSQQLLQPTISEPVTISPVAAYSASSGASGAADNNAPSNNAVSNGGISLPGNSGNGPAATVTNRAALAAPALIPNVAPSSSPLPSALQSTPAAAKAGPNSPLLMLWGTLVRVLFTLLGISS